MRVYVVVGCGASDYPSASVHLVTPDRARAAREWASLSSELDAYLEGFQQEESEHVGQVERMRDSFIDDIEQTELEWVVNNEGPVDEMWTYRLLTAEMEV